MCSGRSVFFGQKPATGLRTNTDYIEVVTRDEFSEDTIASFAGAEKRREGYVAKHSGKRLIPLLQIFEIEKRSCAEYRTTEVRGVDGHQFLRTLAGQSFKE